MENTNEVTSEVTNEVTNEVTDEATNEITVEKKEETANEAETETKEETTTAETELNTKSSETPATKKSGKKILFIGGALATFLIIAAVIIVVIIGIAIGAIFIGNAKKEAAAKAALEAQITAVETQIFAIDFSDPDNHEDEIYAAYEAYEALSDEAKREIVNRETLIDGYKKVEKIIAARKANAAAVDSLIDAIDYSNWFAEADSVITAVRAFNNLDTKERAYLQKEGALDEAYNYVTNNPVKIDSSNLFQAFTIMYSVGEKTNYGGDTTTQDGYWIDWNTGDITPSYDTKHHNDYATPVYIYVQTKYPNLVSECSFNLNLHQTFNGLTSNDVYEYELQSGSVQYDSSMDIGEYVIYVENKDSSHSLLNIFGWSMDWNDLIHRMNEFDPSRIEFMDISGTVRYPGH